MTEFKEKIEEVKEETFEKVRDWRLKENETIEVIKRKAKVIGSVAMDSTIVLMEDNKTHMFAVGVGLIHGLKYKGSFKRGVKGGLSAYGALILANTIQNVVGNRDNIKNA